MKELRPCDSSDCPNEKRLEAVVAALTAVQSTLRVSKQLFTGDDYRWSIPQETVDLVAATLKGLK